MIMKTSRLTLQRFCVIIIAMLGTFFAFPQRVQGQTIQAYVQQSPDKSTLTFYYDSQRSSRAGATWGVNDKDAQFNLIPLWAGEHSSPNTKTTKVVFDASFKNYRPTTTAYWFYFYQALTTIEGWDNLNTSDVTNMMSMFEKCSALETLDLKTFNTTKVVDMRAMFQDCSALKTLNVTSFNTESVKLMGSMFENCSSLETLDLKSFDTKNVEDMGGLFKTCSTLKTLDLKSFDTRNVQSMSSMFKGCSALETLNLESFDTENVQYMNSMFEGCSALETLNLESFETNNVDDMRNLFYGCTALKSIEFKSFNTVKVKDMCNMFRECKSLETLNLNHFNTKKVENMAYMFKDCQKLTTIFSARAWKCEYSPSMFTGCTKLKGVVAYNADNTDAAMANPETGYFKKVAQPYAQLSPDKTTLTFYYDEQRSTRTGTTWNIDEVRKYYYDHPGWAGVYDYPNTTTTKVVFDASFKNYYPVSTTYWFSHYQALTTFVGWENLNTENVRNMSCMFVCCSALETLDLRKFNTSKVKNMYRMFEECSSLKTLDIRNFNTENVRNMTGMFLECSALKTLDLSNLNTNKVEYMAGMFRRSSSLTELNLSNFNTDRVNSMENMFSQCESLKSLDIKSFNTTNVKNMHSMFYDCKALQSLDIKNFNTTNVMDMSFMFHGCETLKTLDLRGFNTDNVKNMDYMFKDCENLISILSEKTWVCNQSTNMFTGCTKLKGAVTYDASRTDATMANPGTGYFIREATSIEQLKVNSRTAQDIYSLQGIRMNGNPKQFSTGVYIVGGKKVLIKR